MDMQYSLLLKNATMSC